ncbi:hypothetical protein CBER1_07642 [Cercospora berteroae]|uniref:Uncharacterized protein n=1 Tax=Cercospora berteroae TaxID=357750 RepID=A0A2S6C9U8_9PEZI|nr:hypothetical protein CBER1_07642 [Cercospora berteroae]
MSFEDGVDRVTKRIRDIAALQLREEFPYMKTASLEKLLDDSVAHLHRDIVRQGPEMQKTLARTSFMSLSPELRNSIYELVLSGQDDMGIDLGEDSKARPSYQPALLRVSRQGHGDASSILYGCNTFKYPIDLWPHRDDDGMNVLAKRLKHSSEHLVQWLQRIGSRSPMVETIELQLWCEYHPNFVLEEILSSGRGPLNSGLTIHQTILQLCGLLGTGVAVEVFKVKATESYGMGREESKDFYEAAGVDGSELFTEEFLGRLKAVNEAKLEETHSQWDI